MMMTTATTTKNDEPGDEVGRAVDRGHDQGTLAPASGRGAPASLAMQIIDPLPHEYLTTEAGVGGVIKRRPEDFVVDELPRYGPTGEGEHIFLCVQKSNTSHNELISVLRRHFEVDEHAIGFAGMKDKVGVTRQTVSIHLPGTAIPSRPLDHHRIQILWAARHANKLRLGHLAGNRFSIRIRDVNPMKAPLAAAVLKRLEREGMPNYFGAQRFGYRLGNHILGAYVLLGEWRNACTHLLGSVARFPEYQRSRRDHYDRGEYALAAAQWTTADRTEHIVSKKLARQYRPRDAVLAIGKTALEFWLSALQSAMFNRVLDGRLRAGRLTAFVEGDIAMKHDNRAVFLVTAADLGDDTLNRRLRGLEIAPTGPLWGAGMMQASGETARCEAEVMAATGFSIEQYLAFKRCPPGQRRPLTVPLRNALIESGLDEHGEFIRVAFDLPRGSYATVALREIMKNDVAPDQPEDGQG
jgi:tRNA pseudouridine13 synthase